MRKVNYRANKVRWRVYTTKTKAGTTQQWRASISYKVQTGIKDDGTPTYTTKRKSKLFSTKELSIDLDPIKNERKFNAAANAWIEELEAQQDEAIRIEEQRRVAASTQLPSASTTVGEYVSAFVDDLEASGNVERVTISGYRTTAARIADGFEGVTLEELTPVMVQKWENGLTRKGLSPATVLKYHRLLSEVCKHAVNLDVLDKNPCRGVKTPKQKAPSPNSLTAEGYARLATTLDNMEPTPVVIAATIAMHTGLRQGEVCGLHWGDYNPNAATITVTESIGKAKGGTYSKEPKTKSSRRNVPVSPQLARALERRRAAMVEELESHGITLKESEFSKLYIVGYVDGRYHSPSLIGRGWKALSGAFGLEGTQGRAVTFHDLRHSFATRAIAAGADVKAVAAVLGHANAAVTLNVYADADAESKRRASELVSQAIASFGIVEPYAELAEAND